VVGGKKNTNLKISVPANSANLGPGFDTLGIAIDLRNEMHINKGFVSGVSIVGSGEDNPKLKKNNLFVNIFHEIYDKYSTSDDKFKFKFINNIPMSGGFGSSSVMLIGAIASAYKFANIPFDNEKILQQALVYENHPDNISAAVHGGFTVSTVENGKVYVQKKQIPNFLKAIIAIPNKTINTNVSRAALPMKIDLKTASYNISKSSYLTSCMFNEKWDDLKIASMDALHQNLRMQAIPELFEVQETALKNGALMSTLSGSGSAFFNMAYENDVERITKKLEEKFSSFTFLVCNFDNQGLQIN
jgi:homoserine kinase